MFGLLAHSTLGRLFLVPKPYFIYICIICGPRKVQKQVQEEAGIGLNGQGKYKQTEAIILLLQLICLQSE